MQLIRCFGVVDRALLCSGSQQVARVWVATKGVFTDLKPKGGNESPLIHFQKCYIVKQAKISKYYYWENK